MLLPTATFHVKFKPPCAVLQASLNWQLKEHITHKIPKSTCNHCAYSLPEHRRIPSPLETTGYNYTSTRPFPIAIAFAPEKVEHMEEMLAQGLIVYPAKILTRRHCGDTRRGRGSFQENNPTIEAIPDININRIHQHHVRH